MAIQQQKLNYPKHYRHEFKYEINANQLFLLKERLPEVLQTDRHTDATGRYTVRSLYFDDYFNSCYQENENGTDPREKFRIRLYNGSDQRISLEVKKKECGMTYKQSCIIERDIVESLIDGGFLVYEKKMHPLLKRLFYLQETRFLRPKIVVEYDRTPFIYEDGNVRVTLDVDIRSSTLVDRFLEPEMNCRPIMPIGNNLLEVKYDEFFPDFIKHTLCVSGLRRTTFSKYYLCRKYGGF